MLPRSAQSSNPGSPAMGVIRKKTATRGGEGGTKYVCDVCSTDITSTVRIRCAHAACTEYDLCVPCFGNGETSHNHQPATHPFRVIEQNSVPIYDKNWGADEELLLLEGCEIYGLGSWADIADHIGGYRTKEEVAAHYKKVYIDSPNFPLPSMADPRDMTLLNENPREEFQARKKRRIETRKEAAKNAPPATPKAKPTASVPACHEVQGYMPGRLEFETEYANEAEEAVQHMQFEPGDGINPRTGELEPEMELKMTVMDIYNSRLTQRANRKKVIFEHNLLDYRKNNALDKKRTKEERDLLNKTKPFVRIMNRSDYEDFSKGIVEEHNLRLAIAQLQEWRTLGIGDLKSGEKYEQEKLQRAQRAQHLGSMDKERLASNPKSKAAAADVVPGSAPLIAPELPESLQQTLGQPPSSHQDKSLSNGHTNGTLTPQSLRPKQPILPLTGVTPLTLKEENAGDIHLLSKDEAEFCRVVRLHPKPYLVIKEQVMKEALKNNGALKKKHVKEICKLDSQKGGRIFEFFVGHGWIGKA